MLYLVSHAPLPASDLLTAPPVPSVSPVICSNSQRLASKLQRLILNCPESVVVLEALVDELLSSLP